MFSIQEIRAKARHTIAEIPGAYLLAIIPVVIGIIVQLMTSAQSNQLGLQLIYHPTFELHQIVGLIGFPFLYRILSDFILLSISLALFQAIYHYRRQLTISDSFTIFNHPSFGKIVITYLLKTLFLFLWGLMATIGFWMMLGGTVLNIMYVVTNTVTEGNILLSGMMIITGFFTMIAGIALFLPQIYAYFLVEVLLFEHLANDTYTSAMAIIKESRRLMKGYKMKGFLLDLSFIGWYLLTLISFGIVGIYSIPYYHSSRIYFYQAVINDRAQKQPTI